MSTDGLDFTDVEFEVGLLILLVAQILSAFMGIYVQDMYSEHGKHWNENLFYSHVFSLPLFVAVYPSLMTQWRQITNTPPLSLSPQLHACKRQQKDQRVKLLDESELSGLFSLHVPLRFYAIYIVFLMLLLYKVPFYTIYKQRRGK